MQLLQNSPIKKFTAICRFFYARTIADFSQILVATFNCCVFSACYGFFHAPLINGLCEMSSRRHFSACSVYFICACDSVGRARYPSRRGASSFFLSLCTLECIKNFVTHANRRRSGNWVKLFRGAMLLEFCIARAAGTIIDKKAAAASRASFAATCYFLDVCICVA